MKSTVEKLKSKSINFKKKIDIKIDKIQKKCKHPKISKWSDYEGINYQCEICELYLK